VKIPPVFFRGFFPWIQGMVYFREKSPVLSLLHIEKSDKKYRGFEVTRNFS
jgi:hypothetical protein